MSNFPLEETRLCHIDRLKVIGLMLVILAHVDLPTWLAQIRSFDVPLLVFASAYLARMSYGNCSVISYYRKRFIRLAVPAWIFSVFFWMVQSIVLTPPTPADVLKGVMFQRDTNLLGMLWIIWVYIVCALLIPFIDKLKFTLKTQGVIALLLAIFQALCSFTALSENRILYCTFFTVVPYGFITYLGYYYRDMKAKTKCSLVLANSMLFAVATVLLWYCNNKLFPINDYKYPAQIYYLCYGISVIIILFQLLPALDKYKPSRIVAFISRSSLWIYLWHILVLYAVKMFVENPAYWWLQYVMVVFVSVCITWMQNKVIDWLLSKYKWKPLMVFKG